ncbi:hypothetical protein TNCV_3479461 [Trichonephila clavipes]|nr:hypothetical protein TNCV_3479461 [Trichonephila clavipes]
MTPRCLKCGEAHQTKECQIKRVETPFCVNCKTYGHMVNYSKCPLYPKLHKGTSTNSNYTNIINSIVRPNISYAQVTYTTLNSAASQQMVPQNRTVPATTQPTTQVIITQFPPNSKVIRSKTRMLKPNHPDPPTNNSGLNHPSTTN